MVADGHGDGNQTGFPGPDCLLPGGIFVNWRTAPGPVPAGRWYLKGGNRLGLYAVYRRGDVSSVAGRRASGAALGERPVALVSSLA
jgi:hypothetical protein